MELNDSSYAAFNLKSFANIYRYPGIYDKAISYQKKALNLQKARGDMDGIQDAYSNLGFIYKEMNMLQESTHYLKRAIEISESIQKNYRYIMHLREELGLAYLYSGDYNRFIIELDKFSQIQDSLGFKFSLSYTYLAYGWSYIRMGNYDKASEKMSEIDFDLVNETNDPEYLTDYFTHLGILHFQQNRYKMALKYFEKATNLRSKEENYSELKNQNTFDFGSLDFDLIIYQSLCKKYLNQEFDLQNLLKHIEKVNTLGDFPIHRQYVPGNRLLSPYLYFINFGLYQLLDDISYLEMAYKQIKDKTNNLDPDATKMLLNYPIPKAIVEEWEKVK